MSALPKLTQPPLVTQAVGQLRSFILEKRLGAEGVLPSEGQLAQMLGVSRTVLREAMKHLQAQGLVVLSQGRRARIKPADPAAAIESLETLLRRTDNSLRHLIEARRPLESEIAALAARRAGADHLERASLALGALETAATLDDQVEADVRFHRVLAEATGNPVFLLLLDTLAGLLRASRYESIGKHGRLAAVEGHRLILEAVARRDPSAARDAMLAHMDWNERQLLEGKP
jgi:GntR family transcriptional repressor for pyruvate dehydrogenase complex